MKYKAIIFDFFGVISTEVAPFWFEKHFTLEATLKLKGKYVHPADMGEISDTTLFSNLAQLISSTPENVYKEWMGYVHINPNVVNLIKSLKENYIIVLCSNATSSFLREILKIYQLEKLFNNIIISSEVKIAKPDKRIFENIISMLNCNPSEIIFIDDNAVHISVASALGIKSITFDNEKQLLNDIKVLGLN